MFWETPLSWNSFAHWNTAEINENNDMHSIYAVFKMPVSLVFATAFEICEGCSEQCRCDVAACALDERLQPMLCYGSLEFKTNAIDIY